MSVIVEAEDLLPAGHSEQVTLEGVSSVAEAITRLPLKRSTGIVILVNGKLGQYDTPLGDGDVVQLIPALGGG
jgi:molybdopterin converting factor small subunit